MTEKEFLENKIEFCKKDDLLTALCNPEKVEHLAGNVTAITISSNNSTPFGYSIAPFTLYQRYWYEDILASINNRLLRSIALIGSAGTSKSTWQYWYIYRTLQSIHHSKYNHKSIK